MVFGDEPVSVSNVSSLLGEMSLISGGRMEGQLVDHSPVCFSPGFLAQAKTNWLPCSTFLLVLFFLNFSVYKCTQYYTSKQ